MSDQKKPTEMQVPCLMITTAMITAGLKFYEQSQKMEDMLPGSIVMGVFMAMADSLEDGKLVFQLEGQPASPFRFDANQLGLASKQDRPN